MKPLGIANIWVIIHLYCEALSNKHCWIWLSLSRQYISIHVRIHPAAPVFVASSINNSDPVPLEAMHAHAITLPPPCSTDDDWSWATPSLFHTFFLPSFWYRLVLVLSVQRMAVPELGWLLLDVFWPSLIWPFYSWGLSMVCTLWCTSVFALLKSFL